MKEETSPTVSEKIGETVKAAEEVVRHPYTKTLARFGFYTKGFLFIVIGILAVLVATGQRGGELADPSGALETIARARYGKWLLIIFIVGAIGHGLWNVLRGAADVDNAGGGWQGIVKRVIAAGVGIFYLGLAFTAWSIITTEQITDRNGEIPRTFAAILLALPLGASFMFLIGLGIVIGGIHECYSGVTGKYKENFKLFAAENSQRLIITVLGVLSFTARALLLGLVGYFFMTAAIRHDPNEAAGLDGALAALAQTYYGKTLLFITATGLICHGVLSLYEARYRRIC
ncbi:MAG TPA: DUF1206 domain-containing protein [Pyrinomonadaceae bacterium]|jgi:hypothetical protein